MTSTNFLLPSVCARVSVEIENLYSQHHETMIKAKKITSEVEMLVMKLCVNSVKLLHNILFCDLSGTFLNAK